MTLARGVWLAGRDMPPGLWRQVDFNEFLAWYTDDGMVNNLIKVYDKDKDGARAKQCPPPPITAAALGFHSTSTIETQGWGLRHEDHGD